jgi:pyridoxal phosphate enzyme (YggS family)
VISTRSKQLSENLKKVRARINTYSSKKVRLIAVSKKFPIEDINCLIDNGHLEFGENYIQEALEKIKKINNNKVKWHYIGRIQSNKIGKIVDNFDWLHTLSDLNHAEKIQKNLEKTQNKINTLVQVNIDNDPAKGGINLENLENFIKELKNFENIILRGMMVITAIQEKQGITVSYKRASKTFNKIKNNAIDSLSMGMSSDYIEALKLGSNMIRLGTTIFGSRNA